MINNALTVTMTILLIQVQIGYSVSIVKCVGQLTEKLREHTTGMQVDLSLKNSNRGLVKELLLYFCDYTVILLVQRQVQS